MDLGTVLVSVLIPTHFWHLKNGTILEQLLQCELPSCSVTDAFLSTKLKLLTSIVWTFSKTISPFFYTNTFLECDRFCSKRPRYLGPYTQIVVRVHFVCSENRTLKRLLQITGSFKRTSIVML